MYKNPTACLLKARCLPKSMLFIVENYMIRMNSLFEKKTQFFLLKNLLFTATTLI